MKFKKCIASLLAIVMIAGSMVLSSNATDRISFTTDEKEGVSKTANISEDCIDSFGEITQLSMNSVDAQASFTETIKNCATISSSDLNNVERIFDCNLSVASAEKVLNQETNQSYTRYTCKDKTELYFDESGELFKISTIYSETSSRIDYALRQLIKSPVLSANQAKRQCVDLMPKIREMFNITDDYPLTDVYDFDEEYVFYEFERLLENGVYNPHQAIKVAFNKRLGKFSIARKFNAIPNALSPNIDEKEALILAEKVTEGEISFDQAQLTYVKQGYCDCWQVDKKIDLNVCYLAYKVTDEESNFVMYIDALSGKCIKTDITLGENAGVFVIKESNDKSAYNYTYGKNKDGTSYDFSQKKIDELNSYLTMSGFYCTLALIKLGYKTTTTTKGDSSLITSMRNYLQNDSKAYAFFFAGHGSETVLGFKLNGYIRHGDVTGNWHFVFLDACCTAANKDWATKFGIFKASKRAFLGWSNTVGYEDQFLFAQAFFPRLKANVSVRQAAVDAAHDVDGDGTTPIRFYGDWSYDGRAHS